MSMKGKKQSPEWVARRVQTRKERGSYNFSDEHRKKLSEAHKGYKWSKESIEKMRNSLKGKKKPPRTKEHCKKISERQSSKKVINRLLEISKKHSTYTNGHFLSNKSKRPLFFRSSLELRLYEYLEDLREVEKIEYEPFILSYYWKSRDRKYVPDVLVTMCDGSKYLLEVKPERQIEDPKNLAKFSSAVEFCSDNSMTFIVVNDRLEFSVAKMGEFSGSPNVKTRVILSQATEGLGSVEGATTRRVSPNNNLSHERPSL